MTRLADRFRRWYDFEKDVHRKVLASFASVPEERCGEAAYGQALDHLAHIVVARRIWLYRLGVAASLPGELFPKGTPLTDLEPMLDAVDREWVPYLERLDEAELERVFEYSTLDGKARFRNRVEDVLIHIHSHGFHHRGQIATALRACGGVPASSDFIFWCREQVEL